MLFTILYNQLMGWKIIEFETVREERPVAEFIKTNSLKRLLKLPILSIFWKYTVHFWECPMLKSLKQIFMNCEYEERRNKHSKTKIFVLDIT